MTKFNGLHLINHLLIVYLKKINFISDLVMNKNKAFTVWFSFMQYIVIVNQQISLDGIE